MLKLSLIFQILMGFVCLWLASSAADSIPFPKEPMTSRDDRITDSYVLAFINYTYRKPDGTEKEFSAEKARYGEGRILNVQGYLVHITKDNNITDNTACSENLRGSRGNALPSRPFSWIALIKRGSCTFDQKIKHVFLHGAAGAIIYNEESSVSLEKMKIIDKDRNITAVFTFKWIGEEMAKIVDDGHPVWVTISEGSRGQRPLTNINKTSVLFVSISFIILMIISLVWLIFYYIQRFRYLQSKDQQSRHLCSVAKRIIMKIPTKNGKFEEKDTDSDCCAICIENYKQTDCIRVLPCRHEFHKNCVDPWLLEHRTCPMCKMDVLKYYGFVFLGSEESIVQLDLDMEIGENGLNNRLTMNSIQQTEIHHEQERIRISPTLQSLHHGLYIYGNRPRSASLQPLAVLKSLRQLQRSNSSNSTITFNRNANNSGSNQDFTQEIQQQFVESPLHHQQYNPNFLIPQIMDMGRGKRQRSKSADACNFHEMNLHMRKFTSNCRNNTHFNSNHDEIGESSNTNSSHDIDQHTNDDDKCLLTNEPTNPIISEPPTMTTSNVHNPNSNPSPASPTYSVIKIQVLSDDE